jgi:glycolate oxidase FAD binding subunit
LTAPIEKASDKPKVKLTADQLAQRLASALGAEAVIADTNAIAKGKIDDKQPHFICRPRSPEEIASALKICSEARAAVVPWGGGAAMAIGNPPRQADVILTTTRLDRVIDHDHANLTVTAQSGIPLSSLQASLACKNQFVPVDPPFPERTTIGGIAAANLNGARRVYYGSVRDLVIGMKVALIDGAHIKAGGKVVKNVAGYDMCKLFVGSLGTLGIITEMTLRVAPLPESALTVVIRGTFEQCRQFSDELFRAPLLPAAAFLFNDGTTAQWRLAIWCEGFEETTARHLRDLNAMVEKVGVSAEIFQGENHTAFWRESRDFPLRENRLIFRLTVPRASIYEALPPIYGWGAAILCDATMGTLWIACEAKKSNAMKFSELASLAQRHAGHAVLFAAPAELKRGIEVWGPAPPSFSLMREIKRQFDPDGLLNPGRFVGGL